MANNPNHEIPFTEARPTEEGWYLWKSGNGAPEHLVKVYQGVDHLAVSYGSEYQGAPAQCDGLWHKLIPSTTLDEAKRRVEELEAEIVRLRRDVKDAARDAAAEQDWKHKQGEDYGAY